MTPPARTAIRARFYLFGTDVMSCAGCYGPPHVFETRAYLYKYHVSPEALLPTAEVRALRAKGELAGGRISPPVCCQDCVVPALRRAARKPAPLSPLAQKLLLKSRRDFAEAHRIAREAAAEQNMARLRALGEDAVAQQMARIIIERTAGQESCERQHLVQHGFTVEEITKLAPAAVARAALHHPDLRG